MSASDASNDINMRRLAPWPTSLNRDYVYLSLLFIFLILNNVLWLRIDTLPPTWDGSGYLVKSLKALDTLQKPETDMVQRLYYQERGARPTFLFVVFAIPFYLLFDRRADVAILGTNLIFYAVIVGATYGLGKLLFSRRIGILAAFVVALNPGVWFLSIRYWPHLSVVAVAVLGAYLVLQSDRFTSKRHTFAFGVLLGLGLMMRPIWPAIFLFGPTLFVAIRALFSDDAGASILGKDDLARRLLNNFRTRILFSLLPALLVAFVIAGPFYLNYSAPIFEKVEGKADLEAKSWFVDRQSFFWYLFNLHRDISLIFYLLFVVGTVLALVKYRTNSGFLLFWFATAYILASIPVTKAYFYFTPIYPTVAVLSVFWVSYVRSRRIQRLLTGTILFIAILTFSIASWAAGSLPEWVVWTTGIQAQPPISEDWKIPEIVRFLGQHHARQVVLVTAEPRFTRPQFIYYSRLQRLDISYVHQSDPWSSLLDADYFVVKTDQERVSRPLELADNVWLLYQMLKEEDSVFHTTHILVKEFPLPDGTKAQLYKRQIQISPGEVLEFVEEVSHWDPGYGQIVKSKPIYAEALFDSERYMDAISAYRRVIRLTPDRPEPRLGLAQAYKAIGQTEAAISQLEAAIALAPDAWQPLKALADLYRQQGQLEHAVVLYDQVLEIDPTHIGTHYRLGQAYADLDMPDEAKREFKRVIEIDPEHRLAEQAKRQLGKCQ